MIILFHHIQKTGGTTLLEEFARVYGNEWRIHPGMNGEHMTTEQAKELDSLNVPVIISSHSAASLDAIHREIPNASFCTILREPLDRTISHFAHLCRSDNTLYKELQKHKGKLVEFFAANPETELNNLQTRQLARGTADATVGKIILLGYNLLGYTHDMRTVIERFNMAYGTHLAPECSDFAYNISPNRPSSIWQLSQEAQQAIHDQNTADIELYEWAQKG